MRYVLFLLAVLVAVPAHAQSIPDAAWEEAIGRDIAERTSENGKYAGGVGTPWSVEFTWRKSPLRVKIRAAAIAASAPAPDACLYRIIAANDYPQQQLRIAAQCTPVAGGDARTKALNDAIAAVRALLP